MSGSMMGQLTDWQTQAILESLQAGNHYVSLHYSDPGTASSPTATEIPGTSYVRRLAKFERVSPRAMRSITKLTWSSLGATVVTHLGIWTTATGGSMRAVITLVTPYYVVQGGTYELAPGDLYYRFP